MDKLLERIPPMLSGKELEDALAVFPEYREDVAENGNQAERLIALSDLYKVYIPTDMSKEVYNKLYLAMLRSLQKKQSKLAVKQYYQNYNIQKGLEYNGIMGGADSFTIIAPSGTGKSSAIARCIDLITKGKAIETEKPYNKILPIVQVQCPFDCSVKGMLLEILRVLDTELDTNYYSSAIRTKATVDRLIGTVSSLLLQHNSLLIIDEIQNIIHNKNGKQLIGSLIQLINNSSISTCMIGVPEVKTCFSEAQQLARRSIGLEYEELEYGEEFINFCRIMFRYQYVKKKTELSDGILHWLYEHSQGNISIVAYLIYNAQEIAILNGTEELNINTLREAYLKRMSFLHGHIKPRKLPSTSKLKKEKFLITENDVLDDHEFTFADLVKHAKSSGKNIIEVLEGKIQVERVNI